MANTPHTTFKTPRALAEALRDPKMTDEDRAVMRDMLPRQRLYFACDESKLTLVQETGSGGGLVAYG